MTKYSIFSHALSYVNYHIFLVIFLVSGCSTNSSIAVNESDTTGKLLRKTLQHDGLEREYFVYLPHIYNGTKPLPLVIALHGYGTSATGFAIETTTGFNHYAEREGFIAVYPQATHFTTETDAGEPWVISSWNDLAGNQSEGPAGPMCTEDSVTYPCPPECGTCVKCHWASCNDDIGFMKELLKEISTNYNTDQHRYYLAGISMGAAMAQKLTCELDEKFSAVALVIGRLERGFNCSPDSPVALMQINGGLDTSVPADGNPGADGYYYTSSKEVAESWAQSRQCKGKKAEPWVSEITVKQGLKCVAYNQCSNSQSEIIDCLWPQGKHVWPGNIGGGGWCVAEIQKNSISEFPLCRNIQEDVDIWGTELIWNFFMRHSKSTLPGPPSK